ncbi:hypothetical protein [Paraburkholderia ultramafica]|uniref:hypothetical protein n=1 Tax=Paraburkholderia ultramafica TaxID=1544867 RepID=UPI00158165DD|nr:hypothetical protein [Paraburkholderia ultramafica]
MAFLSKFENLLRIAARHGIKVSPIFYDDCWNPTPQYGPQPAPVWGVHNSRWVQSPGTPVEQAYFQPGASNAAVTYKASLASYITDFVAPHRDGMSRTPRRPAQPTHFTSRREHAATHPTPSFASSAFAAASDDAGF